MVRPAGAHLATAGAGAFWAAQFLPDIANGIRTRFGRECPPAGSIEGRMCADLTNMAGDMLSRRGTIGPIGYLRAVKQWIKASPSYLRNWIARGASSLKNMILGLRPEDPVRDRTDTEPAPLRRGTSSGNNPQSNTSGTPVLWCRCSVASGQTFIGWTTTPSFDGSGPYHACHRKWNYNGSSSTFSASCDPCLDGRRIHASVDTGESCADYRAREERFNPHSKDHWKSFDCRQETNSTYRYLCNLD